MPLGGLITGLFGSDKNPRAIANRLASGIQGADRALATSTLKAIRPDIANAFDTYMAGQGQQEGLAAQQEGVLQTLLGRRMANDPQQSLRDVFQTAFAQIDPNVVAPLARFDVNSNVLAARARGINPGSIDSTAERLRNARIASGRYYDVARNVYNVVPQLYNSAYAQGQANDQAAAGFVPQISAGYEAVASRPTQGILNRLGTVGQAQGVAQRGIANALAATQGYKTPKNFADRLGGVIKEDEAQAMQLAQGAMSALGSMGQGEGGAAGAGGGGGAGLASAFGGGGSIPRYGAAPGFNGMNY